MQRGKVLIVDDNQGIRSALKLLLSPIFSQVDTIASPNILISTIENCRPDVVLLDMNFHTDINTGNEGLYWTSELKKNYPDIQIVLFTAYADIALAVEGMKRGAFDFIVKPWNNDKLISVLKSAYEIGCDKSKKGGSNKVDLNGVSGASNIEMYWGNCVDMMEIRRSVEKIAPTDATILITGENGTGKDLLAREIHTHSNRRGEKMVCVDVGAITETLFESELFGHVKGAFTDAHSDHIGKFEQANGGTLFLDEIGNIPLHLQAKLLRVLQNRKITRVGSEKEINIDIRLICATNVNLERMVSEGRFREDLYYRISTVPIHIPPLRERASDILPLSNIFLKRFATKYRREVVSIAPEAAQKLISHYWSGNIRELQNVIEKAVILSEGEILTHSDFVLLNTKKDTTQKVDANTSQQTLQEGEKKSILEALERCNGNLSMVAKQLGISRPTLYSKLKKYDI